MNTRSTRAPKRRESRPWGLVAVLTLFFLALAMVLAIGVVSLGLNPALR